MCIHKIFQVKEGIKGEKKLLTSCIYYDTRMRSWLPSGRRLWNQKLHQNMESQKIQDAWIFRCSDALQKLQGLMNQYNKKGFPAALILKHNLLGGGGLLIWGRVIRVIKELYELLRLSHKSRHSLHVSRDFSLGVEERRSVLSWEPSSNVSQTLKRRQKLVCNNIRLTSNTKQRTSLWRRQLLPWRLAVSITPILIKV